MKANVVDSPLGVRSAGKAFIRNIGSRLPGQGSCVFVESDGLRVVVDCGVNLQNKGTGRYSTEELAAQIVATWSGFIILTHFHVDHWAGLQAVIRAYQKAGMPIPPIIATDITWALLQRQPFAVWLVRGQSDRIQLIPNRHSVEGSAGALILGSENVLCTSDFWAMDLPKDLPKVGVLIINCTKAYEPNPKEDKEQKIQDNILALIRETLLHEKANFYGAMFSTHVRRALDLERKIEQMIGFLPVIMGASLRANLDVIRPDFSGRRSERVVLLTGVWAHDDAALMRLANGEDYERYLKPGDTVALAGSIPTWNPELTAQIEAMCRKLKYIGVRLVVDVTAPKAWEQWGCERKEIHNSGHGHMPEIAGVIDQVQPEKVVISHASPEACAIVECYCRSKGIIVLEAD